MSKRDKSPQTENTKNNTMLRDRYLAEFLKTNTTLPENTPKLRTLGGINYLLPAFEMHVKTPQKKTKYENNGISPPRGVLLYGEHGVGKTFLSKCMARELDVQMIKTRMVEKELKEAFRKAELIKPCFVLIDEVDKVDEEGLVVDIATDCFDNHPDIFVIGTAVSVSGVDEKLKRCEYLENSILVKIPGVVERREILKWFLENVEKETDSEEDKNNNINYFKKDIKNNGSSLSEENSSCFNGDTVNNEVNLPKENLNCFNEDLKNNGKNLLKENFSCFNGDIINNEANQPEENLNYNGDTINNESRLPDKNKGAKFIDSENKITATICNNLSFLDYSEKKILKINEPFNLIEFAVKNTPGFLPDELKKLVRLSVTRSIQFNTKISVEILRESINEIKMRVPEISFDDIGALEEVKSILMANVIHPITNPALYAKYGISRPGGVLLHGPPGSGKTLLARAVSGMGMCNFISIRGPELISKYVGDSEKELRALFSRAKALSPCVLFFDEIDSICSKRSGGFGSRIVNQILTLMDGMALRGGVYVIAATNRIEALDSALLRPGRFDCIVKVPQPDRCSGIKIFKKIAQKTPMENFDFSTLDLIGFSGADISNVVRDAGIYALNRNGNGEALITRLDVDAAIAKNRAERRGNKK